MGRNCIIFFTTLYWERIEGNGTLKLFDAYDVDAIRIPTWQALYFDVWVSLMTLFLGLICWD
jgi:hypothetical protein